MNIAYSQVAEHFLEQDIYEKDLLYQNAQYLDSNTITLQFDSKKISYAPVLFHGVIKFCPTKLK